jgi:hypothetical protein
MACKRLAGEFLDALFGEGRLLAPDVFQGFDAWSDWFRAVAWDYTWVLFDCERRLVWVLTITDTD